MDSQQSEQRWLQEQNPATYKPQLPNHKIQETTLHFQGLEEAVEQEAEGTGEC